MTDPVLIDWNDDKRKDFRQGVVTARHVFTWIRPSASWRSPHC